jgi:predicted dienelactone hydrolase
MGAEIRLSEVSPEDWNASYADPRITHVVAIDPGLTWGLNPQDGAGLVDHVRLIGLGEGEARLLATNFDASGFAKTINPEQSMRITPAMHFTALPLCKPMAEAILIEEQDDPVCSDPVGTDRSMVHDKIVERMVRDLGL